MVFIKSYQLLWLILFICSMAGIVFMFGRSFDPFWLLRQMAMDQKERSQYNASQRKHEWVVYVLLFTAGSSLVLLLVSHLGG